MCGISGIVGEGWERSQLEAMVAIQDHRGPDDNGIYVNASGLVGLGHNRLSIVDLTDAGHQPMVNRDRTVWIVFNGEIYNYLELRQELKGYPFRSRTDTEVILAATSVGAKLVEHSSACSRSHLGRAHKNFLRARRLASSHSTMLGTKCFSFRFEVKGYLA